MVLYMLEIKAELENIYYFRPNGGIDDPDHCYYFKVKCGNCGEVNQKESCVCFSENYDIPGSRGSANLVQKCKFCGREMTVQVIQGKGNPYFNTDCDAQKFVPLMLFDCRGFEPVDFTFKDLWFAEAKSGTKFTDIDLSEGDFVEYDEKGECPVGISELQHRFVRKKI